MFCVITYPILDSQPAVWSFYLESCSAVWQPDFPYVLLFFLSSALFYCSPATQWYAFVISVPARHSGCSLQHHDGELWQRHVRHSGVRCLGKQRHNRSCWWGEQTSRRFASSALDTALFSYHVISVLSCKLKLKGQQPHYFSLCRDVWTIKLPWIKSYVLFWIRMSDWLKSFFYTREEHSFCQRDTYQHLCC